MHLPTRRHPRPFPVADRFRDGALVESEHPREAAIRHLRETIAAKRAGVDPFDRSLFILVALPHELTWAYRALELCGSVLVAGEMDGGGRRLKAILEADVRLALGLDLEGAPEMEEPLASRAVDASATAIMDSIFSVLPEAPPILSVLAETQEPVSRAAIERAKEAYDAREGQVH
jgi:hypothetical protein